jgi:hypothetical protein
MTQNEFWLKSMSSINVVNPASSYRFMIIDLTDGRFDVRQRIKVLVDKKLLNKEEQINLHEMINSEDLENLEVVKAILDEKEKIKTWKDKLKFWKK